MKKKNIMIIFLCAALLMICIIAYASEGQEENNNPNISDSTESEAIIDSIEKDSEQYAELSENEIEKDSEQNAELSENEIEHINTAIEEYTLVFDKSGKFKELTKEQLLTLGNIYSSRYRNTKLKKVLEFLGIIEEGLPSITMEEANEICSDPELIRIKEGTQSTPAEYSFQIDVMKRFNKIAGAPDLSYPSAFATSYVYYLDGKGKEYITFYGPIVEYKTIDKKTGEVTEGYMFESDRIADERIKEDMRKEEEERRKVDPYELKGAYEFYYEKATAEQKAELEKVKNVEETAYQINCSESSKTEGFYEKKILEIMGEIPKDMPMLTFEQAKEICADETILMQCEANTRNFGNKEKNRATIIIIREKFDKIAGAPDWTYGNLGYPTSLRHVYFLNEEHTEYIVVASAYVFYYREDGKGKELDCIRLTPYQELRKDGVYLG